MYKVNKKDAFNSALFFLCSMSCTFFECTGIERLNKSSQLIKEPLIIYDLNNEYLFYDYYIKQDNLITGSIRCSASKLVGSAVISFLPDVFSYNVIDEVEKLVSKNYPKCDITSSKLVCYCYPKVGVLVELDGSGKKLLYDAYTYDLLDENIDLNVSFQFKQPGKDTGHEYLSYIDNIPEGSSPILDDYKNEITIMKTMYAQIRDLNYSNINDKGKAIGELSRHITDISFAYNNSEPSDIQMLNEDMKGSDSSNSGNTKDPDEFEIFDYELLSSYFDKNPPIISSVVLPLKLIGQETKDYCVMATAQMIFDYYNINPSQSEIAQAMKYSTGGVVPENQVEGFEKFLGDEFDVVFDNTPTWEECISSINNYYPLKVAVPGHSRACRGWKKFVYLDPSLKKPVREDLYLLINDPSPINKGSTYWESTKIHMYRNSIYLYKKDTPKK